MSFEGFIKESTAVTVKFGPFVDSTDGDTEETALTIAQADVRLSKNGGNFAQKNETSSATHDELGYYDVDLDTTDTDTVGQLKVAVHESGALLVEQTYQVIEADIYDALFASGAAGFDSNGRVDVGSWLGTAVTLSSGNLPDVNIAEISDDATAADNLELMYDGTGLSGDTFPARQDQVSSITTGSAGLSVNASGATITTGSETNSYTDTATAGTIHIVEDAVGTTDFYYDFDLSAYTGVATEFLWTGYIQSNGDTVEVQYYEWSSTSYKTIRTLNGANGTTLIDETFDIPIGATGTGANFGEVRLRFNSTTTTAIGTDRVRCVFTQATAGISNGSTITLSATTNNTNYEGRGWILELGGQDIGGSYFRGCKSVTGTGTCANGSETGWENCDNIDATLTAEGIMRNCGFLSLALTSSSGGTADKFAIFRSQSNVAGSGAPTITLAAVTKSTSFEARGWLGGGTWAFNSFCTASISVQDGGTHTITTGGGDVELRGRPKAVSITSSGTGTTNVHVITGSITIAGTGGTVNVTGLHSGITDNSGGSVTINDNAGDVTDIADILADTNELQTNQGDWATATGFAIPGDQMDLVNAPNATAVTAIQSGLMQTSHISATAGKVDGVALVDTVTDVTNLHASAATAANQTTILNRLGSFAGSGVNTILGFFQALMRSDATTPSDVGGTYDDATDSLQAIRDRGDAAWVTGGGGSAPTVEEIRTEMDDNSTKLAAIVADTNELQTNQGNWTTATGFSTHNAADVWAVATRVLTANTNLNDLDAAGIRAAIGLAAANLDTQLNALPTAIENADALLIRDIANVEDSLGDHMLGTAVQAILESVVSGSTWNIYKTDGATVIVAKTVTTDAGADPITGVS